MIKDIKVFMAMLIVLPARTPKVVLRAGFACFFKISSVIKAAAAAPMSVPMSVPNNGSINVPQIPPIIPKTRVVKKDKFDPPNFFVPMAVEKNSKTSANIDKAKRIKKKIILKFSKRFARPRRR